MRKSREHSIKWANSLRTKFALVVIITLVAVLGILTALEYSRNRENSLRNLSLLSSHIGRVIENDLQYQMLATDLAGIQNSLVDVGELKEIQKVYFIDLSGEVIFSSQEEAIGLQLDNQEGECQSCHELPAGDRPQSIVVTLPSGEQVFRSMQLIENKTACKECHNPNARLLGLLLTDVSIAPYQATIKADLRENLWWSAGAILLTVFLVVVLLNQFVIQRLERLSHAITSFGHGELHAPIRDATTDEIGKISWAFDEMARQVEARETENLALSVELERRNAQRGDLLERLITAQEDERKRVARELHDDLGQTLGGVAIHVEALDQTLSRNDSHVATQLSQIKHMIVKASDRMYDLILDLRPSSLDDFGLVHALRTQAERVFKNNDIVFELKTEKFNQRLPTEIETALFRVFQEALNNVFRHADANRVTISLACSSEIFKGLIVDDGKGFDLESIQPTGEHPRGLGLLGMQERVIQCGGELDIQSGFNQGTHISIVIPLEGRSHG